MARADGVQPLFRFGVDVGTDNLADKNYMVARLGFRHQCAFKIRNGIGEQDRINLFSRGGFAIEFGEFIYIPS